MADCEVYCMRGAGQSRWLPTYTVLVASLPNFEEVHTSTDAKGNVTTSTETFGGARIWRSDYPNPGLKDLAVSVRTRRRGGRVRAVVCKGSNPGLLKTGGERSTRMSASPQIFRNFAP